MTESRGDWIQTASGRQFWPIAPRASEVFIGDISHALSMLCRFGGHCIRFYSVAEHCILLSRAAAPQDKRWALLHDASEAYLVDVPRPLKPFLAGYREAEEKIMGAVCERFGLDSDMPPAVKDADKRILFDERTQNMATAPVRWATDADPLGVTLEYWSPQRARHEFMTDFRMLFGESA